MNKVLLSFGFLILFLIAIFLSSVFGFGEYDSIYIKILYLLPLVLFTFGVSRKILSLFKIETKMKGALPSIISIVIGTSFYFIYINSILPSRNIEIELGEKFEHLSPFLFKARNIDLNMKTSLNKFIPKFLLTDLDKERISLGLDVRKSSLLVGKLSYNLKKKSIKFFCQKFDENRLCLEEFVNTITLHSMTSRSNDLIERFISRLYKEHKSTFLKEYSEDIDSLEVGYLVTKIKMDIKYFLYLEKLQSQNYDFVGHFGAKLSKENYLLTLEKEKGLDTFLKVFKSTQVNFKKLKDAFIKNPNLIKNFKEDIKYINNEIQGIRSDWSIKRISEKRQALTEIIEYKYKEGFNWGPLSILLKTF